MSAPIANRTHEPRPRRGARHPIPSDTGPPQQVTDLATLPLMLQVSEAAAVLRISRSSAYKLAGDWEASGGRTGLPVVRLGGRLLVRRVDLARIVGVDLSPSRDR